MWLTRPTVLPSESVTNAIHSSVPAGPSASSWCWKMTCGSDSTTTPTAATKHKAKHTRKSGTAARSVSVQVQATHGYGSYVVARVASPGGRQLYAGTLEPGKIQTFRSSRIWFRIDAPANVLVSVNGKRRVLPGRGHPRLLMASPGGRLALASVAG